MDNNLSPTQQLVYNLYKDEKGDPITLSKGQDVIFRAIAQKACSRVHCMCHTRFGKSMTVGLGVLSRASTFPEKWAIIAGTKDKAKIIMDYVITHIFDNEYTAGKFVPEKGDLVEDIRRHRNKNRVTFKTGTSMQRVGPVQNNVFEKVNLYGEIFVGSAKDALGFGAPNVIEDESALINDAEHSLVMRMLGDNPNLNFMCKIGNPFTRGHFLNSYMDPKYKKIIIDCYKSLKEGRISQDIIDENRDYPYFKVLYECLFPSASEVDESGWSYLLTDADIKLAQSRSQEPAGERRLGVDVQRGGRNYNAWVLRSANHARLLKKTIEHDLIGCLETTIEIMNSEGLKGAQLYVDDAGVGGGLVDMLKMRGVIVNDINFGERTDDETCLNTRAQVYAGKEGVMSWIKQGGALEPNKDWIELTRVRYRKDSSGKTRIEPKEDMRKRGVESPDVADALALTFAKDKTVAYYGNIDPIKILSVGGSSPHGGVGWN